MTKLRDAKEVREWLHYLGLTIAQWARDNGYHVSLVREVLAGRKRCLRGQSHNIAVALGMKHGVPTDRPARAMPSSRSGVRKGAAT